MADDWQIGDLALCVKLGQWIASNTGKPLTGPTPGSIHRVSWIGLSSLGNLCLLFDDVDTIFNKRGMPVPWQAHRFRKIRPLTDEERDRFLADLDEPVHTRQPVMTILEKGRSL